MLPYHVILGPHPRSGRLRLALRSEGRRALFPSDGLHSSTLSRVTPFKSHCFVKSARNRHRITLFHQRPGGYPRQFFIPGTATSQPIANLANPTKKDTYAL